MTMASIWSSSFLLTLLCFAVHKSHEQTVDTVITKLAQEVANSQVVTPTSYKKQVGVYPCNIRVNFNGNAASKPLRDAAAVFDNNAFVTLWVTTILLEAAQFKSAPQPSYDQLKLAIEAVATYHDKNQPTENGILVFWPQTLNSTSDLYYCDPQNLTPIIEDLDDVLSFLHKILKDLGLEKFWDETLESIADMVDNALIAFHIPPDFDDTFVNLGLGAMLSHLGQPDLYQLWKSKNMKNVEAMIALKKYPYKPFTNDSNANFIDTRTFFYIRDYLYEVQQNNLLSASFATTWVHNINEDKVTYEDVAMPFHANNIDLTVSTNVVYGLSSTLLIANDSATWFDAELQMVYENTTDLIAWLIERNFSSRPDLALTYYPSIYNFYWFTARTLNLLRSYTVQHGALPYSVMERVMNRLSAALRGAATRDIVANAKMDEEGLVYFDDFLGDNDRDIFDKPENHAEDRICSTAVAVNALFYIWTENQKLLPTTPQQVLRVVYNASQWLVKNVLSDKYKPYNVLFSGSVKTMEDLPFFYPAKDVKYLNGSVVPPNGIDSNVMMGDHGVIPKQEYQEMLTQKHFGQSTPLDFHGYNGQNAWPFWSSEPFTHASALLTLTQYRAFQEQLDKLSH